MIKQQLREMIINGYAYPSIKEEVVRQTAPNLTFFSLFHYDLSEDGHLIDLNDQDVIEELKPYGVAPLMVITAISETGGFQKDIMANLLQSEELQAALIQDIVRIIKEKDLAGVDFDFEYVYPQYKDAYAALIFNTRRVLNPMGYVVTATVSPKTSSEQKGLLYEGHDYAKIGAAANLVLVMTYEWGYTYGPPMAVAPLNKVREVLDYAVTQIPPCKLLMGIPNYGYDWTLPFVQGESKARSLSNVAAEALAREYGVEIQYDKLAQSPYFFYTTAGGTEHEVWFENQRSYDAKMKLAAEFDLAGIGIWNLMNYSPALWQAVNDNFTAVKVR